MSFNDTDVAHHPGRDAQDAPPVAAPAIVLVRDGDEVSLLADEQPAGVAQILFVVHLLVLHPASIVVGVDPRDLDPLQPLSRRRTKTRRGRLQPESWRVSSRPCHPLALPLPAGTGNDAGHEATHVLRKP